MCTTKIILLLNSLKKDTGGSASALELAETLSKLGYGVNLGILNFNLYYQINKGQLDKTTSISANKIHYVPGYVEILERDSINLWLIIISNIKKIYINPSKNNVRRLIESVLLFFNKSKRGKFENILNNCNIIIIGTNLSGLALSELKAKTNAIIIQNHAGSPQTFERFWITEEHVPLNANPELSLYVNFCLGFDKILFQAEEQAKECSSRHPDLKKRVITIYPTCNETDVQNAINQPSPYTLGKKVIVNVGSIQPRKAQHRSIEAFFIIAKDFPEAELHFVGGFNRQKKYLIQLRQKTQNLGLNDRIFFHGYRKDYLSFMIHATVLLQSSEAEGVSRVLREAMFMKLPIVSFAISGTSCILEDKREALLVPPKNSNALGKAISLLLEQPNLARKLATNAYMRYQLKHSNSSYVKLIRLIFENLLKVSNYKTTLLQKTDSISINK